MDLKARFTSLGTFMVWPSDAGKIDEASVKANYRVLTHLPSAFLLWEDITNIPSLTWVLQAVVDSWEAWFFSMEWWGMSACLFLPNCTL